MKLNELILGKKYIINHDGTIGIFTKGEHENGFKIEQNHPFVVSTDGLVRFGDNDFDYKESCGLSQEDKDFYYDNIRTMIMVQNGYDYNDIDDEEIENFVNREADKMFETIFEEKY